MPRWKACESDTSKEWNYWQLIPLLEYDDAERADLWYYKDITLSAYTNLSLPAGWFLLNTKPTHQRRL